MHDQEQGDEELPIRITPWDLLALISNLVLELSTAVTRFLSGITNMLVMHADFVDEKLSFHEYAARTIEKLRKGE
jgi:hypothetical protein